MKTGNTSMRPELARELRSFGFDRRGQVVCIVVLTEDEFEFVFPKELSEQQIGELEQAIAEVLADNPSPPQRI